MSLMIIVNLFLGKDLLETDLFERSMVAQDEAVTRILQLNKKFDTVMVYPAFGNEVSKSKALNSSELLRLYHWLTSWFARKSDIMWFFANQMYILCT